jgi:hypothetical protein
MWSVSGQAEEGLSTVQGPIVRSVDSVYKKEEPSKDEEERKRNDDNRAATFHSHDPPDAQSVELHQQQYSDSYQQWLLSQSQQLKSNEELRSLLHQARQLNPRARLLSVEVFSEISAL